MENKKLIEVTFQDLTLEVQKDDTYEWLLDTKSVAEGYGVSEKAIHEHKRNKKSEILENIHFIRTRVSGSNPRAGIPHWKVYWTKRGVINLGFHIKSERAIRFRYWAEDLILGLDKSNQYLALKDYFDEKFTELKTDLKNYVDVKNEELKLELKNHITRKQDNFALGLAKYLEALGNYLLSGNEWQEGLAGIQQSLKAQELDASLLQESIKIILIRVKQAYRSKHLHFIYLFKQEGKNRYKIGYSKDILTRKEILNIWGDVFEVHKIMVGAKYEATLVEKLLHKIYKDKRISKEIFELETKDVDFICGL